MRKYGKGLPPLRWAYPEDRDLTQEQRDACDPVLLAELLRCAGQRGNELLEQLVLGIVQRMGRWKLCVGRVEPIEIALAAIAAGLYGTGFGGELGEDGKRLRRRWEPNKETAFIYLWNIATSFLSHEVDRTRQYKNEAALATHADAHVGVAPTVAISNELVHRIREYGQAHPKDVPAIEYLCGETTDGSKPTLRNIARKHGLSITALHAKKDELIPVLAKLLADWKH
jgi:hypothetical protein